MACICIKITPRSELHPEMTVDLHERLSGIDITAFAEFVSLRMVLAERLKGFSISRICSVGSRP